MCSRMSFLAYAGQPAVSSFIPPSVDSIILDYQSPNAQPGFYPNEDPNDGGIGETLSSAIQAFSSRLFNAGWENAVAFACFRNLHIASLHRQVARLQYLRHELLREGSW